MELDTRKNESKSDLKQRSIGIEVGLFVHYMVLSPLGCRKY